MTKSTILENRRIIITVIVSFLAGAFWLFALRFVTLKTDNVHYHANFAVFVDEERLELDSPLFYEEIQACGGEEFNPKNRVHMHDFNDHLIHVHDSGATWGHFFANLGMTHGDSVFRTPTETYIEDENTKIRFILNGEEVFSTANVVIKSEDKLLISVGSVSDEMFQKQYEMIETDAGEFNNKFDPAGCSGGKEFTLKERILKSIGIFDN